jgi:hypothetical protein
MASNVLIEGIKEHIVESTALVTTSIPVFGALEKAAAISHSTSANARLIGAAVTYAGVGWAFFKGRDLSRRFFGISERKRGGFQQIHDAAYFFAVNALTAPPFYYLSGERDLEKIVIGTGILAGTALLAGGPICYLSDCFGELVGTKKSHRLPACVRNLGKRAKRGIAAAGIATFLTLTALIYGLTPHNEKQLRTHQQQTQEQAVQGYVPRK